MPMNRDLTTIIETTCSSIVRSRGVRRQESAESTAKKAAKYDSVPEKFVASYKQKKAVAWGMKNLCYEPGDGSMEYQESKEAGG